MFNIKLNNFQDGVDCNSILYRSKESFIKTTYEFQGGHTYGIISDFGCGSWGITTCVGGRCSDNYEGQILLNDEIIHGQHLKKYSCFISENLYDKINSLEDYLTPRHCIEKALKISELPYDPEEIREVFHLSGSKERFDRDLRYVSGEIWIISMAIGFASGKNIFCFPWLNEIEIGRFQAMYKNDIIKFLKDNGKIVLIPSSQKKLQKYCDHVIQFKKGKVIYR